MEERKKSRKLRPSKHKKIYRFHTDIEGITQKQLDSHSSTSQYNRENNKKQAIAKLAAMARNKKYLTQYEQSQSSFNNNSFSSDGFYHHSVKRYRQGTNEQIHSDIENSSQKKIKIDQKQKNEEELFEKSIVNEADINYQWNKDQINEQNFKEDKQLIQETVKNAVIFIKKYQNRNNQK